MASKLRQIAVLMALGMIAREGFAFGSFIEVNKEYNQTGASTVNFVDYSFELYLGTNNVGDYNGAVLTYPGPGSPKTMTVRNVKDFSISQFGLADTTALRTAYPFGNYNVALGAGNLAATTVVIPYTSDSFETSTIPALTPGAYNALNGMDPTSPFNFTYSPFTVNTSNNANETGAVYFELFDITGGGAQVVFKNLPNSSTGYLLPANSLLANRKYQYSLFFLDNQDISTAFGIVSNGSFVVTSGSFTTGSGVPEPSSMALVAIGLIALIPPIRKHRLQLANCSTRAKAR